jgi:hypothetical protein
MRQEAGLRGRKDGVAHVTIDKPHPQIYDNAVTNVPERIDDDPE